MGKFKQKMYKFMYGRYGVDKLYNFCTILIIVALFANILTSMLIKDLNVKFWVSTAILAFDIMVLVWSTFRFMSRNIAKRRRENERFIAMTRALARFFTFNTSRRSKSGNADNSQFVFRDCTKCGAALRLPRKAGTNKVKCPRCSHKFNVKVKKFK